MAIVRVATGEPAKESPVLPPPCWERATWEENVRLAVYAVVSHVPGGTFGARLPGSCWVGARCGRDGQPYPCRWGRWGRRTLLSAGLPYRRLVALVAAGDPYVWPLP